jgi:hypothetical protein
LLQDNNPSIRNSVLTALTHFRLDPKTTLPVLNAAVEDPNPQFRLRVVELRWRLDHDAGTAVPVLVKLLSESVASQSLSNKGASVAYRHE